MSSSQDYHAINQLVCSYASAVDRRDFQLLGELFVADAVQEIPHLQLELKSRDQIIAAIRQIEMFEHTWHAVHNQVFEIDGSHAKGEVYSLAYHFNTGDDGRKTCHEMGIRYQDQLICQQGRWKFSLRRLILDWEEIRIMVQP